MTTSSATKGRDIQRIPTCVIRCLPLVLAVALAGHLAGCHLLGFSPAACTDDDTCAFGAVCVEGQCALNDGPTEDAGESIDGGPHDGGAFDAGAVDGGDRDGGRIDGGRLDAGVDGGLVEPDAGLSDAGTDAGFDGGGVDGGNDDGGVPDGGVSIDAGPIDAGSIDAGDPDLYAFWRLDGNGADSVGGHHATTTGPFRYGRGISGQAAYFDSTGTLNAGVFPEFNGATEGAISGWFRDDAVGTLKVIAGFGDTTFPDFSTGTYNNNFFIDVSESSDTYAGSGNYRQNARPGEWHHFAVNYDASRVHGERTEIYLDGLLRSATTFGPIPDALTALSSIPFVISRSNGDGWRGFVDELRFHRRALTPSEVLTLANEFSTLIPSGFIFYAPFDANFNDVTRLDGGYRASIGAPELVDTAVNVRALSLANESLEYSPPEAIQNQGSALTISMWVNAQAPNNRERPLLDIVTEQTGIILSIAQDNAIFLSLEGFTDSIFAASQPVLGTPGFSNDAYHHVAVVFDGNRAEGDRAFFYVDGVPTEKAADLLGSTTGTDASGALHIGGSNATDADIDEVLVYDRALAPAEVSALYLAEEP